MRKLRIWIIAVAVAVVLSIPLARWANDAMTEGPDRESAPARLVECPDTPNCVCTSDTDEQHGVKPITFDQPREVSDVLDQVEAVVGAMGGRVVARRDGYLHATFTTPILRFIDDVEFLVDPETRQALFFRSASRVGRSDLGLNRRRMNRFRKRFLEL